MAHHAAAHASPAGLVQSQSTILLRTLLFPVAWPGIAHCTTVHASSPGSVAWSGPPCCFPQHSHCLRTTVTTDKAHLPSTASKTKHTFTHSFRAFHSKELGLGG